MAAHPLFGIQVLSALQLFGRLTKYLVNSTLAASDGCSHVMPTKAVAQRECSHSFVALPVGANDAIRELAKFVHRLDLQLVIHVPGRPRRDRLGLDDRIAMSARHVPLNNKLCYPPMTSRSASALFELYP